MNKMDDTNGIMDGIVEANMNNLEKVNKTDDGIVEMNDILENKTDDGIVEMNDILENKMDEGIVEMNDILENKMNDGIVEMNDILENKMDDGIVEMNDILEKVIDDATEYGAENVASMDNEMDKIMEKVMVDVTGNMAGNGAEKVVILDDEMDKIMEKVRVDVTGNVVENGTENVTQTVNSDGGVNIWNDVFDMDIDVDIDLEIDIKIEEYIDEILWRAQKPTYLEVLLNKQRSKSLDSIRTKLFDDPQPKEEPGPEEPLSFFLRTPESTNNKTGLTLSVNKDELTKWENAFKVYFERHGFTTSSANVARGTQLGVKRNKKDKKQEYTITFYPTTGRIGVQTSLCDEFRKHLETILKISRNTAEHHQIEENNVSKMTVNSIPQTPRMRITTSPRPARLTFLVPKDANIARSETESDTIIDNIESQMEINGEDITDLKGGLNEIREKLRACS